MKCPICENKIKNHVVDFMEHILMEEHATCKDERHFYSYEFVTGNEREVLGDAVIHRYHNDPPEEIKIQDEKYKRALQQEKERYHNNPYKG